MAQLAALLRKEFSQSSSATSGITAYGNTGKKKRRKGERVRLVAGSLVSLGKLLRHAAAIEQLGIAAEVCETNAPINDSEGNLDQAELERRNSAAYRAAMAVLAAEKMAKWNEDQERDELGRFGSGGGSSSGGDDLDHRAHMGMQLRASNKLMQLARDADAAGDPAKAKELRQQSHERHALAMQHQDVLLTREKQAETNRKRANTRELNALFSDSLGMTRADMPQIPNDFKPQFATELGLRGISTTAETVAASSLKPTQKEFNPANVAFLRQQRDAGAYKDDNPIVVSREGRVLDGHHRWAVEAQDGGKLDVLRVDLPIADLLREAAAFNTRQGIASRSVGDKVSRAKLGKLLKAWDPDQPRDEAGRWAGGGGSADLGTAPTDAAHLGLGSPAGISTPVANLMQALNAEHLTRLGPEAANKLTSMYRAAAETKPGFDKELERIAGQVGGKAVLPPLKGSNRATEKIVDDYAGDASQIKDLLRATVEVSTVAEAQSALGKLRESFDVQKGGFRNLLDPSVDPVDGYRDIKLNVKINGVTAEIQINVPAVLAVKDRYHKEYEERRTIEGRVFAEHRQPSADEQTKIDALNATMKAAYADVWKKISG